MIVDEASHVADATFYLSFPQTVPIVVSRILRVHGLLGHEPNSKNLQNKQGTGGGVSTDSLMLKLVKEIGSVLIVKSAGVYFHILFSQRYLPYLSRRMLIHFPWEMGDWFPKWKGGQHVSYASTVFPFG